jgi:hypothetical protein
MAFSFLRILMRTNIQETRKHGSKRKSGPRSGRECAGPDDQTHKDLVNGIGAREQGHIGRRVDHGGSQCEQSLSVHASVGQGDFAAGSDQALPS